MAWSESPAVSSDKIVLLVMHEYHEMLFQTKVCYLMDSEILDKLLLS